jgi:hypothetical protein
MDREQYDAWSRAASFFLKLIGILGIIFIPVFWAVTGRIELAFLPFFGTLAGVGQGLDVLKEISQISKADKPQQLPQSEGGGVRDGG